MILFLCYFYASSHNIFHCFLAVEMFSFSSSSFALFPSKQFTLFLLAHRFCLFSISNFDRFTFSSCLSMRFLYDQSFYCVSGYIVIFIFSGYFTIDCSTLCVCILSDLNLFPFLWFLFIFWYFYVLMLLWFDVSHVVHLIYNLVIGFLFSHLFFLFDFCP